MRMTMILSAFTREQKIGAGFLLVFGVLTVGLGALQLRNTIYSPFVIRAAAPGSAAIAATDEMTRLKNLDTDHDGLSDYDELYVYHTSPYLPDTDSDGIPDKVEIEHGTNPLCPEGKTCIDDATLNATASSSFVSPLFDKSGGAIDILGAAAQQARQQAAQPVGAAPQSVTGGTPSVADIQAVAHDPVALRKLLLQTGKITAADLQKIDDATLLSLAQQIIASGSSAPAATPAPPPANPKKP